MINNPLTDDYFLAACLSMIFLMFINASITMASSMLNKSRKMMMTVLFLHSVQQ